MSLIIIKMNLFGNETKISFAKHSFNFDIKMSII